MATNAEYETVEVTLYAESSDRFRELKDRVDDVHRGRTPSNSELVRLMMDHFDPDRRA